MPFTKRPIRPIVTDRSSIARSVIDISEAPVVLFHKQGASFCSTCFDDLLNLATSVSLGPVIDLTENDWEWSRAPAENFNCHTLAIGSQIGLSPHDWLEGKSGEATLHCNPAQVLLDSFFEKIAEPLSDNDVFTFRNSKTNHLVHSGFVRWIDGAAMAVSKFGEGPILLTTLDLLIAVFGKDFDQIDWYRVSRRLENTTENTAARLKPAKPIHELAESNPE